MSVTSGVVSRNPEVLGGTPVFAGTRVPVDTLIDWLIAGETLDYFLDQFPTVTRGQAERFLREALAAVLSEGIIARPA